MSRRVQRRATKVARDGNVVRFPKRKWSREEAWASMAGPVTVRQRTVDEMLSKKT
jgi:hypothetical protein